jgi:hypothetical protein
MKDIAKNLLRLSLFGCSNLKIECPALWPKLDSRFSLIVAKPAESDLATYSEYLRRLGSSDFFPSDLIAPFANDPLTANPRYLLRLSWPLVLDDFIVAISRDTILQEPGYPSYPYQSSASLAGNAGYFRAIKKRGTYLLLSLPWWNNYYHWIAQVLPKLHGFLECLPRECFFIVSDSINDWQLHSLLCLGVAPSQIVRKKNSSVWSIENLLWMTPVAKSAKHSSVSLKWLKHSIFESLAIKISAQSCRVYITRSAAKRSIANESEFIPALVDMGFLIVECADLTLSEQVHLFSRCNFICGPHGAGLANMIWCMESSVVYEIANSFLDGRKCFWNMAVNLGHDYRRFSVHSLSTCSPDDAYRVDSGELISSISLCLAQL